jgi:hypothetical protein
MKPVDIQRVRHVPRELLRSSDLRVQLAASQERRRWHNRALHDAMGIASGMTVALANNTSVVVQAGVAYDCYGRELLLVKPRTLDLPADRQRTLDVCYCPRGSMAEAELHWRSTNWGGCNECIPLAELSYEANEPVLKMTRLHARPLARPRIGYGTTPVEGTPWQPWIVAEPHNDSPAVIGLQVGIDTTAAGFTETPCYFAWLQWPQVATSHLPYGFYFALGFQYVEESTIDKFRFRLLPPPQLLGIVEESAKKLSTLGASEASLDEDVILSIARGQRLSVSWLGIQHQPDPGARHEEGT